MAPSPSALLTAIKGSGVRYELCDRWDDPGIAASGAWAPSYVVLHHTANGGADGNAPSLNYCLKGSYPPIRNCHFLVGRDGLVYVLTAYGCYHAGEGGPGRWGDGPQVAANSLNHYAYGIEIESKGTSTSTSGGNGYTDKQQEATAALTGALLDLMGRDTGCAINHRTWAPNRKTDTLLSDGYWHDLIDKAHGAPGAVETEDDMLIRYTDASNGNKVTYWLLSGGRLTNIGSTDQSSWTGSRLNVTDAVTWDRISDGYPVNRGT